MVVPVQTSLSLTSRWLTRVIAVTYLLLGLTMFVLPGWSAHHFPWKVSPFVAMTIGSYLLGSAWMAGIIQHTWTFARVYTLLLYLWLFGVLETVVVARRRLTMEYGGRLVRQRERLDLARTDQACREIRGVDAMHSADGIAAWRWWTLAELDATTETVWPAGLAGLIRKTLARDAAPDAGG